MVLATRVGPVPPTTTPMTPLTPNHSQRSGIRISARPFRLGMAALAGLLLCLAKPVSAGIVTITMIENGGSISVTLSGSLDFSSPGYQTTAGYSNYIDPAEGSIGLGLDSTLVKLWTISTSDFTVQSTSPVQSNSNFAFSPFGSGSYAPGVIAGYSGSPLFLYSNGIGVDRAYGSGTALSGTGTISGTFASHGITLGTSTTQFTLGTSGGSANTLIVQRSVPDEMPTVVVGIGLLLLGLASRQRRH